MEQKRQMIQSVEHLSQQEKLELFNVEELETRLEMAAVYTGGTEGSTDGSCQNVSCNSGCWA